MGECQTSVPGITVHINGEARTVPAGLTIAGLLQQLGIQADRVAVEMDRSIVRQPQWPTTPVEADARLEIVTFVGGG